MSRGTWPGFLGLGENPGTSYPPVLGPMRRAGAACPRGWEGNGRGVRAGLGVLVSPLHIHPPREAPPFLPNLLLIAVTNILRVN